MDAFLSRLRIYPIKSLDPIELDKAEIGRHSLRYDREFAMITPHGRFMNGKKSGKVNELEAIYDLNKMTVTLAPRLGGEKEIFHLIDDEKK